MTNYLDDHMFEDIGHSNEARKQLKEFLVGPLNATEEEIAALEGASGGGGEGGAGMAIGVLVAVVAIGVGYYFYSQ